MKFKNYKKVNIKSFKSPLSLLTLVAYTS